MSVTSPAPELVPRVPSTLEAERSARRALRGQIGKLEAQTALLVAQAHPVALDLPALPGGVPRLQSLAVLEARRDLMANRLEDARRTLTQLRQREADARGQVELMLADPKAYRWLRVSREDAGLVGCGHWHVRPRLGLIGMLAGWWHVKISSGCPLSGDSGKRRALDGQ